MRLFPLRTGLPVAGMDCRQADADTKGAGGIPGAG